MKKTLALTVLLLLALCVSALADCGHSGEGDFDPELANLLDYSASKWYRSGINRALLTVLLVTNLFDEALQQDQEVFNSLLLNESYVGYRGGILVVAGTASDDCIIILYDPSEGSGHYNIIKDLRNAYTAISKLCESDHHANSVEDIIDVTTKIGENL